MALAVAARRMPAATAGYRRILVPLLDASESERAVETACRLAAEHRALVTVVTVVEVPPFLPLDARMDDEEALGREAFVRAEATADAYGVGLAWRRVRARDAATAILEELEDGGFELVVVCARRRARARKGAAAFGRTVQNVLRKAPCRVLVIAPARA